MFEFYQYSASESSASIRPANSIEFASGIRQRSLLIWGEHCVECAAPECYQTCDLYKARPDQRCRRFEVGMRRNNAFTSETGSAADIVFGKWGKLEARGNTLLFSNRLVKIIECVVPRLQPVVNAVGRIVRRFGGSAPWTSLSFELSDYAAKKLHAASRRDERPDGFLIEIYNPAEVQCNVKFSCAVSGANALSVSANGKIALPYWKQLVLTPGYSRVFVDYRELSAVVESGFRYNLSFTPEEESGTHLVFISADFITTDNPDLMTSEPASPAREKPAAKCVVFDLDNTLWDGVLVEGEVSLKASVPELFRELDKRGILLTVASKNNEGEALQRLAEFGLSEFLVYPVINWNQKSENIKWLAKKISVGVDTFIFIDDSPFEREEVASAIEGIEVLPETALDNLLEHPRLRGSSTTESGNRRVMYQQQVQRSEAAIEFGEDYLAFLKACDIIVSIGGVVDEHHQRVAELLQRTNQLNFSGTKYSRDAVAELLRDTTTDKHVIHCKDKHGEYGLVGFAMTKVEEGRINVQDFMLSCRVQGKLIEKAFFSYLVGKYTDGAGTLEVNFLATDRNALARSVLQEIGFSMVAGEPVLLEVTPGKLDVDFLTLRVDS